jgi:hypothetical protein
MFMIFTQNFTSQLTDADSVSPRAGLDVVEKMKMQERMNDQVNQPLTHGRVGEAASTARL